MYSCTGILGKQYFLQDIPGVVWIVGRYGSGLRDSSGFSDSNDLSGAMV